jgi:hypothetical protein
MYFANFSSYFIIHPSTPEEEVLLWCAFAVQAGTVVGGGTSEFLLACSRD